MKKIAVISTSHFENEKRVPIIPEHIALIPDEMRANLSFEKNYGHNFGVSDEYILRFGCKVAPRDELVSSSDVVILPKPTAKDIRMMRSGSVLFGWAHVVQQYEIAQAAIDNKVTILAWESMFNWVNGAKAMHLFYRNNELAGYCAILHALEILGIDGYYGPRRKVTVFGYGSVSKGAIYALNRRGFNNIYVLTARESHLVSDKNPDVYYGRYHRNSVGEIEVVDGELLKLELMDFISDSNIIVNGVLQDPTDPIMFMNSHDLNRFDDLQCIIDISCDAKMGFDFAKPTSFNRPTFIVGRNTTYYSVDHTPSYLWRAASREISMIVLSQLTKLTKDLGAWEKDEIFCKALEVIEGRIVNRKIIEFQRRLDIYPYQIRG